MHVIIAQKENNVGDYNDDKIVKFIKAWYDEKRNGTQFQKKEKQHDQCNETNECT